MSNKKTNYQEYVLDPVKPALIQPTILEELRQFVVATKNRHTKFNFPQMTTWYNRKTHKPVDLSKKKISQEKLNKDYYQNINLETTEKGGKVVYDDIGLSAIKLQAAFEEVFRFNVDEGNAIPRPAETKMEVVNDEV